MMPHLRLRECMLVQVTIRSPTPVRPANVRGSAPISTPSLSISARPLVISAAFALSPYPMPSDIPAPSAMIFLSEPPSSAPTTSSMVYILNLLVLNSSCMYSAYSLCFDPTVTVVGRPFPTSSACDGPESVTYFMSGIISYATSDILFRLFCSMPFATLTATILLSIYGFAPSIALLKCCAGAENRIISLPSIASFTLFTM